MSERARVTLVILSFGLIVTSIVIWLVFHRRDLVESRSVLDFSSYYAAAYALRMNPQANVYDQAVLTSAAAQAGVALQPPLPYIYPLPFAYLLIPLAYLPFSSAAFVFFYLNLAIWIGCVLLMAREARHLLGDVLRGPDEARRLARFPGAVWERLVSDPAPLLALALASATFLMCRPLTRAANLGQVTFFVLLPLALVPWLTRRRHERWVGAMIGIAAILKIIPALLFAYLLLRWRWQALLTGIAVVGAAAIASVALVGWNVTYALVPLLLSSGIGQSSLPHNQSLLGPVSNGIASVDPTLGSNLRSLAPFMLAALALGVGWALWRSLRLGQRGAEQEKVEQEKVEQENVAFAVASSAFVLLVPVTWVHYYAWALIGALLLLALLIREAVSAMSPVQRRHMILLLCGVGLGVLLINAPLPFGLDTDPAAMTPAAWGVSARWILEELRPLGALLILEIAIYWLLAGAQSSARAPSAAATPGHLISSTVLR
jgi:hypothetical protein